MKKVVEALEYLLAATMVLSGLQTILSAVIFDQVVSPLILIAFGVIFLFGGLAVLIGNIWKLRALKSAGMIGIVGSLLFGFFLEFGVDPGNWKQWIDSLILFLIAATIRVLD